MAKEQGYFGRLASSMKRGLTVATIAGASILGACGGGGGGGTTPEPPTPVNRGVLASQLGSLETILANPEVTGLINDTGINYPTNDPSLAPNIRGNWDGSSYDLSVGKQYHNRAPGVVLNGQNIGQVYMRGNDNGSGNGDWTAVYVTEQNVGDANNDGNPDLETKVHFLQGTKTGNSSTFKKGSVLVGMHGNDVRAENELGNTQYNTDNMIRTFVPEQVVKLSEGNGGSGHAAMVTGLGELATNGDYFWNATGFVELSPILRPRIVPGINNVDQVAVGSTTTYFIDSNKNAYEIGTQSKDPNPRLLTFPNGAKPLKIISRGQTTVALMDDGTVTGMPEAGNPATIPGLSNIEKIAMTATHLLTADNNGVVRRTWFGDPDETDIITGIPANVREITADGTFYSALTLDGRVYASKLGETFATEIIIPTTVEELDGSGEGLAIRGVDGNVYGFNLLNNQLNGPLPWSKQGIIENSPQEFYFRSRDKYGNVFSSGFNNVGQFGDGTTIDSFSLPIESDLEEIE